MSINVEKFLSSKGNFVSASFTTTKKPAAAHKLRKLQKSTTGVFRAGINFANLGTVKTAIANGDRGEVQPLPWGEWYQFPYIIKHKDIFYLRFYPAKNAKLEVVYLVDDQEVSKEVFNSFLTPSDAKEKDNFECFVVKCDNITALCDTSHQEVNEAI